MTWCTMSWKYSTVSKNNMTKLSVINCEGELEGNWREIGFQQDALAGFCVTLLLILFGVWKCVFLSIDNRGILNQTVC